MEFNATIDLIIRDLEEAGKIIDDLKRYPGIPVLQVELAKAKCKSAGEVIALLKTMEIITPTVKTESVLSVKEQEPVQDEKKKTHKPLKVTSPHETEIIRHEPEIIRPLHSETIHSPEVIKTEPLPGQKKEKVTTTIGEKFITNENSFNEKFVRAKNEEVVSEILKSKAIKSLSEAIGVNERFLFIKEIFDGKMEAYEQAIARLDKVESINDAKAVIMSFTGDNKENEAVMQLIDLVKRKLPSNE